MHVCAHDHGYMGLCACCDLLAAGRHAAVYDLGQAQDRARQDTEPWYAHTLHATSAHMQTGSLVGMTV